jgi:hypothetical protein
MKIGHSLVVGIIAIALIGAGFGLGYWWEHRGTGASNAQGCLDVSNVKLQRPSVGNPVPCNVYPCVVGIVQNTCSQRFEAVSLTYNLYDSSGAQVGSTAGVVSNLEPHTKARLSAIDNGAPKTQRFKLTKIEVVPAQ